MVSGALLALLALTGSAADYQAHVASPPPTIDGVSNDPAWQAAHWYPIDQLTAGTMPTAEDFSGRFKVVWDAQHLYVLAQVTDDVLFDGHSDPLTRYWDDDALEIFIDEDRSGGDHLTSYNAFAYHVALDNQVVDIGPLGGGQPRLFNHHITSRWQRDAIHTERINWELAIKVYASDYTDDLTVGPVLLKAGKTLGFMVAYCDNDGSEQREHFLGSHPIKPINGDRNRGYIDASVFGLLRLRAEGD